ncbi:MAG: MarR family transcriptional regulator [Ruminococcaceae bacterium]|nr:MarR family transcriptional regulator [Oscillospiraceae bacterium]
MKDTKPIGFVIKNLSRMIGRRANNSAGRRQLDSLTGTNGWIIGYLAHNSDRDIFQKDIENHFSVRRSTVSRVVTLMEQKGLVERQGVEGDARLKRLVLTEKAWQIHSEIENDLEALEERLVIGISDEELDVFRKVAVKMMENIDDGECGCHRGRRGKKC